MAEFVERISASRVQVQQKGPYNNALHSTAVSGIVGA
jgi:hypothetical protein